MVYCTKCGTKNEEGVEYCTKCGANLGVSREQKIERRAEEWGEQFGKRAEKECFGLPHGGTIAGLIIGAIIIIVGLSQVPGLISPEVREVAEPLFWPVIIIVFGILIVTGALYGLRRRP
jgi:uncharacterized membrane protein YvbJ